MKITIKYAYPEPDTLEIGFYRGEGLLHNVFYDVAGLNDGELSELAKEAVAKFCAVFPEIPKKDVMKGFSAVDTAIEQLYYETFNPRRAGRKQGKKIGHIKTPTVVFARRVTPAEKIQLENFLSDLRNKKGLYKYTSLINELKEK